MNGNTDQDRRTGIWYAIGAYATWGILPLYWHTLEEIPALEILAHRIWWSFLSVALILLFMNRWSLLKQAFQDKKSRNAIFLASVLITLNWFTYIWAVNAGHVIDASLGYYINPLFSILLGVFFLKERLNFWQVVSLLMAAIGVCLITVQYGKIPWVAFLLTVTFGLYGLAKKLIRVDSMVGLTLETTMMMPLALIYILYVQARGIGSLGAISFSTLALLMGTGIVTVFPLFWFAQGAKRVSLSTIGFIQYLSPTISLLLGIFVFKEAFTWANMVCFGFIWVALLIFSLSHTPFMKEFQPKFFKKSHSVRVGDCQQNHRHS
ncbi:MAG TPA: EamA family transporter RarD [Bacillota bacterium]|nr:EamA family transporter RarD [Bacillota bacterium]